MELEIYQIDAFTSEVFRGNPACVVPLSEWLDDNLLIKIAKENNVSETAFFVKIKMVFISDGLLLMLRWIYAVMQPWHQLIV